MPDEISIKLGTVKYDTAELSIMYFNGWEWKPLDKLNAVYNPCNEVTLCSMEKLQPKNKTRLDKHIEVF